MVDSITENYFAYTINQKVFSNSNLINILGGDYYPPPEIDEEVLGVMLNFATGVGFRPV